MVYSCGYFARLIIVSEDTGHRSLYNNLEAIQDSGYYSPEAEETTLPTPYATAETAGALPAAMIDDSALLRVVESC
jgi:hypothetical protein